MLSGRDLRDTIGAALATLGRAVDADRVYIFENHDPATGAPLMSQRYEWCADAAAPQIDNPELQNLTYEDFFRATHPTAGQAIEGLVREFPETERVILEPQAIRSILVLPIDIDDRFGGSSASTTAIPTGFGPRSRKTFCAPPPPRSAMPICGCGRKRGGGQGGKIMGPRQKPGKLGFFGKPGDPRPSASENAAITDIRLYVREAVSPDLSVRDLHGGGEERRRYIAGVRNRAQFTTKE